MKFNEYIEYVKETCLEIGEEKGFQKGEQSGFQKGEQKGKKEGKEEGFQLGEAQTRMAVVKNMLHQGKSKKDIQIALGLTATQTNELIRSVQNNAQA
jgi:predicted transposase YdaD